MVVGADFVVESDEEYRTEPLDRPEPLPLPPPPPPLVVLPPLPLPPPFPLFAVVELAADPLPGAVVLL